MSPTLFHMAIVDKSSAKPRKPGQFVPGDPRIQRGRGPAPGTGGRPRDEFRALMRELVSRPETVTGLEAILSNPDHPAYLRALEFAAERGYGKESNEVAGGLTLTVVRRDESGLPDDDMSSGA